MMLQTKATAILLLSTVMWGGSFLFNKIGLREIPPVQFFFFRFALAALLMGGLCLPRLRRLNLTTVKRGALVGVALTFVNLTFVFGVSGTSISRAGYLNNLFVLIIPLLSFTLWRERVDRLTFAGILLALVGVWALASGGSGGFNRGDLVSTVCALFIAIHILTVSRVLRDEDLYLVTLVQFVTVALAGGLLCLALPWPRFTVGATSVWAVVYCAVFPTVVAFTLQNAYQRYVNPTKAGLIYTLDPVWSMFSGMLFLGERLTPREGFGCLLILAAVAGPLLGRLVGQKRRPVYLFDKANGEV